MVRNPPSDSGGSRASRKTRARARTRANRVDQGKPARAPGAKERRADNALKNRQERLKKEDAKPKSPAGQGSKKTRDRKAERDRRAAKGETRRAPEANARQKAAQGKNVVARAFRIRGKRKG